MNENNYLSKNATAGQYCQNAVDKIHSQTIEISYIFQSNRQNIVHTKRLYVTYNLSVSKTSLYKRELNMSTITLIMCKYNLTVL